MPDDLNKRKPRVIARSITHKGSHGKVVYLTNPLDRGYLCQKMCGCNTGTAIRNQLGHELKQRCTSVRIWADEEINQLVWRYKAEVGFSMKANPPKPLMSVEQPNRPSRFPLGRAMGEGLFKRELEGGPQKGLLRIPDCIVLNTTGAELAAMRAGGTIAWARLIPVKPNIEIVLEIKFAGDRLDGYQQKAYETIAGEERFRLLKTSDCNCGRKRAEPATEPVRVPVTTPMKRESEEPRRWYQLPPPQPLPAPPPLPQLPQYGPIAMPDAHRTLATVLKENPGTTGVVLLGAILLAFPVTRAVIVGAVGATLVVASSTAPAATNLKKKDPK